MKLLWSRRSERELASIEAYSAERNPGAGQRVSTAIVDAAYRLETFPQLGRPSDRSDVRLLQVPGLPYLLPYRVRDDDVEILAVFDERMERPEAWT